MDGYSTKLRCLPILIFLVTVFLNGCAPTTQRPDIDADLVEHERQKQQELALRDYIDAQERLVNVGWPLLKAGLPICKQDAGWGLGAYFATSEVFAKERRDAARRVYGVDERLRIMIVVQNSAAQEIGLRKGDIVHKFNGHEISTSGDAITGFKEILDVALEEGNALNFVVERDGERLTLSGSPQEICKYNLFVVENDQINAYADGDSIGITTGMMRFADTDKELALVVGHEIAHNAMEHITAKTGNMAIGLIFDILAAAAGVNTQGTFSKLGAQAYSQDFEAEADYVGMYVTARAGLELEGAADFWRRMASAHPGNIENAFNSTHPSTAERFVQIEETIEEIRRKRDEGMELLPEVKYEPAGDEADTNDGPKVNL